MSLTMRLLIPACGRGSLMKRLLDSLAEAALPDPLRRIVVVENGEPCGVRSLCQAAKSVGLPVEYRWSPEPSKSKALNLGFADAADDELVVMSDDDVRFEPQTLAAYEKAALARPDGWYFGGPFHADYEERPPAWVEPYLPPSARGWNPDPSEFDPGRSRFFGCNWAVFARDLRAVGGFDARYGPGTTGIATGEETVLQAQLHARGLKSQLVRDAVVWHFVPAERCDARWAVNRAHRHGAERGLKTHHRGGARVIANHALNAARFTVGRVGCSLAGPADGSASLFFAYERARAEGYFAGYRAANAGRTADRVATT
ncbi:glycosyltransferase [Botrimarina sp.]|uniref:glycosyltransferase n=1 Tax=Botrimarina sp. TaxID=2795802 RepID=UPI0032EC324A